MKKVFLIASTFVWMNWAAVLGLWHFFGDQNGVWLKYRHALTESNRTHRKK